MFDGDKSGHSNFLEIVYKLAFVNLFKVNDTAIVISVFELFDFRFIFNHFGVETFPYLFFKISNFQFLY